MESGQQLAFDEGIKWACARRGCDQEDHVAVVRLLKQGNQAARMQQLLMMQQLMKDMDAQANPKPKNSVGDDIVDTIADVPSLAASYDPRESAHTRLTAKQVSEGRGVGSPFSWTSYFSGLPWGEYATGNTSPIVSEKELIATGRSKALKPGEKSIFDRSRTRANSKTPGSAAGSATSVAKKPVSLDPQAMIKKLMQRQMQQLQRQIEQEEKQYAEREKATKYNDIARTRGPRAAQIAQMNDQHAEMERENKRLMLDPRSKALEGSPERRMWNEEVTEMADRMGENRRIAEGRPLTAEEKVKRQQRADANNTKARAALMESAVENAVQAIETGTFGTPNRAVMRALNGDPGLREEVSKAVLQRLEATKSPQLNKARQSLAPWVTDAGSTATPPATGPAATPPAADPAATPPAADPAATPPAADPAATPPAADPAATPPAAGPLAAGRKPGVPSAAVTQASKLPTRSIARELTPEMMAQERMQMQLRYGTKGTGGDAQITNLQPRQTPMTGSAPNSLGQAQAIGQVASSKMKMVGGMGVVPPNQSNMPAGADVAQAGPRPSPAKTGVISPPPEPGGSNKSDSMSA